MLAPITKTCRCGRGTLHHLACDEAHAHEYPKCGVDVCERCQFNVEVCKCKKARSKRKAGTVPATKRLSSDQLKESLARMAEDMKVLTGYPRENEGWNAACDEIASRIRFTKQSGRPARQKK